MLTGYVLFEAETVQGLLARVLGIIGPFPEKIIKNGKLSSTFFTKEKLLFQDVYEEGESNHSMTEGSVFKRKNRTGKMQILVPKKSSLKCRLKTDDMYFLDFVKSLLQIDPAKRPTAKEAMNHPWFTEAVYPEFE